MSSNHEKNCRSKISWHTPFKGIFTGLFRKAGHTWQRDNMLRPNLKLYVLSGEMTRCNLRSIIVLVTQAICVREEKQQQGQRQPRCSSPWSWMVLILKNYRYYPSNPKQYCLLLFILWQSVLKQIALLDIVTCPSLVFSKDCSRFLLESRRQEYGM